MPRPKNYKLKAAAQARVGKAQAHAATEITILDGSESDSSVCEVTSWVGGVNHDPFPTQVWLDIDKDDELSDAEEVELVAGLERQAELEIRVTEKVDAFRLLKMDLPDRGWKKAEAKRGLGYTGGLSDRSQRRQRQKVREKEERDAELRKR
jgi:hypothetical protein